LVAEADRGRTSRIPPSTRETPVSGARKRRHKFAGWSKLTFPDSWYYLFGRPTRHAPPPVRDLTESLELNPSRKLRWRPLHGAASLVRRDCYRRFPRRGRLEL